MPRGVLLKRKKKKKKKEDRMKPKIANKNIKGAPGRRSVMTMLLLKSDKL